MKDRKRSKWICWERGGKEMTKEELQTLIESYFNRITYINDCFELYKYMNTLPKSHLKAINEFPAFFQISRHSFIRITIIELAKLYDYGSDTGINKLICICDSNRNLFLKKFHNEVQDADTNEIVHSYDIKINIGTDISECKSQLNTIDDKITILKKQRDKFYAHLDKEYQDSPEKLSEDFFLSYDDIKKLINTSSNICNKLYLNLCRSSYGTQSSNWNDIDNIILLIEKYFANESRIFENEIKERRKNGQK